MGLRCAARAEHHRNCEAVPIESLSPAAPRQLSIVGDRVPLPGDTRRIEEAVEAEKFGVKSDLRSTRRNATVR